MPRAPRAPAPPATPAKPRGPPGCGAPADLPAERGGRAPRDGRRPGERHAGRRGGCAQVLISICSFGFWAFGLFGVVLVCFRIVGVHF